MPGNRPELSLTPMRLRNLKNTCYINCSLQALLHDPFLTDFFLDCFQEGTLKVDLMGARQM